MKQLVGQLSALQNGKQENALAFVTSPLRGQRKTIVDGFAAGFKSLPPVEFAIFRQWSGARSEFAKLWRGVAAHSGFGAIQLRDFFWRGFSGDVELAGCAGDWLRTHAERTPRAAREAGASGTAHVADRREARTSGFRVPAAPKEFSR